MFKIVFLVLFVFVIGILFLCSFLIFENNLFYGVDLTEFAKALIPSLATASTAIAAYLIYLKQRRDDLQRIAATIYFEIQEADNAINRIKEQSPVNKYTSPINEQSPPVLPYNSWMTNKHLFSKLLPMDLFITLNSSFEAASEAEDCRKWALSIFREQAKQKATSNVDAVVNYRINSVLKCINKKQFGVIKTNTDSIDYNDIIKDEVHFKMLVDRPMNLFHPDELNIKSQQAIYKYKNIINSPSGEALRKLARL